VGVQQPVAWPPAATDQPLLVRAALKELLNGSYPIDPDRFILSGLSDGASYVYHYVQHEVDSLFRSPIAIVPMSMAINALGGDPAKGTDFLTGNDLRFRKIQFIGYCGASDPGFFLQPMQRYVLLLQKAGYVADVTTYAGAHNNWNMVYDPKDTYKLYSRIYQYMAPAPVVVAPPPVIVPPARTILSVTTTYLYSDSTKETVIRP
jgi:hypothetical protein